MPQMNRQFLDSAFQENKLTLAEHSLLAKYSDQQLQSLAKLAGFDWSNMLVSILTLVFPQFAQILELIKKLLPNGTMPIPK